MAEIDLNLFNDINIQSSSAASTDPTSLLSGNLGPTQTFLAGTTNDQTSSKSMSENLGKILETAAPTTTATATATATPTTTTANNKETSYHTSSDNQTEPSFFSSIFGNNDSYKNENNKSHVNENPKIVQLNSTTANNNSNIQNSPVLIPPPPRKMMNQQTGNLSTGLTNVSDAQSEQSFLTSTNTDMNNQNNNYCNRVNHNNSNSNNNNYNNNINNNDNSSFVNNVPLGSDEERKLKQKFILKLQAMKRAGVPVTEFTMNDSIEDIREEFQLLASQKRLEQSITIQRAFLMVIVSGIEYLNTAFDPLNINLSGWSTEVNNEMFKYDTIFEDLHEMYEEKLKVHPLVMLSGAIMLSAVQYAAQHSSDPTYIDGRNRQASFTNTGTTFMSNMANMMGFKNMFGSQGSEQMKSSQVKTPKDAQPRQQEAYMNTSEEQEREQQLRAQLSQQSRSQQSQQLRTQQSQQPRTQQSQQLQQPRSYLPHQENLQNNTRQYAHNSKNSVPSDEIMKTVDNIIAEMPSNRNLQSKIKPSSMPRVPTGHVIGSSGVNFGAPVGAPVGASVGSDMIGRSGPSPPTNKNVLPTSAPGSRGSKKTKVPNSITGSNGTYSSRNRSIDITL